MRTSQVGIDLIKSFESLRLDAYLCPAGIPTIGYGHTRGVHLGQTITPEFAAALLCEDIEAVEDEIDLTIHVPTTPGQWDALVSFAFNVKGWQMSTLVRKLNAGDIAGAGAEFPRWNHAAGKVLPGLTRRRNAERALFLS